MEFLRRLFLERMWTLLSALVGFMQLAIVHWGIVVVTEGSFPPPIVVLPLAAVLLVANLVSIPVIARARGRGGPWRRASGGYMALCGMTILVGLGVVASWLFVYPLCWMLVGLGGADEGTWQLYRVVSQVAVGGLAGSLLWGFTGGQIQVRRTRIRVAIPGLDERHHGLRIAHITDLHIGNGLEGRRLERMVRRVNALDPDIIVITGDIFDFEPRVIVAGARGLSGLRARLGVFGVLGNHDYYAGMDDVASAIERYAPSIRLLRDEVVALSTDRPLYLAGVDDPGCDWASREIQLENLEKIGKELAQDGPTLLLVHRPGVFRQAARLGFPLVLAGHTHGGQIALPLPGRHWNLARLISHFDRGLYHADGSTLYVSRGIGVAGPAIRLNCTREIAIIELACADVE